MSGVIHSAIVLLDKSLANMDEEQFRVAFKGSPMKRAKLRGLKRNAAVVLENQDRRRRLGRSGSVTGP